MAVCMRMRLERKHTRELLWKDIAALIFNDLDSKLGPTWRMCFFFVSVSVCVLWCGVLWWCASVSACE